MRIGQFTDTFYPIVDGVGRVVFNYATHLPRLGHECYVIAPMMDTGYRGGFPFELVDFTGTSLPGSPQYKAGVAILDRHYHARIANVPLDVIHAHAPFPRGWRRFGSPQSATFRSLAHSIPNTMMTFIKRRGMKHLQTSA